MNFPLDKELIHSSKRLKEGTLISSCNVTMHKNSRCFGYGIYLCILMCKNSKARGNFIKCI